MTDWLTAIEAQIRDFDDETLLGKLDRHDLHDVEIARRFRELRKERDRLLPIVEWFESQRQSAIARGASLSVPEDPAVLQLCFRHGFGAVIDSACRQWLKQPHGASGAFFVGGSVGDETARAALSTQEEADAPQE